jgi:hypothetical protein
LRSEAPRKVPDGFQASKRHILRPGQARHEVRKLRVIWYSSQSHLCGLSVCPLPMSEGFNA